MRTLPKWVLALGGVFVAFVLFLIIVGVWLFSSINGTQKDAVHKESDLTAQYQNDENVKSSYVAKVHEMLGVTNSSTAALDQVIRDAVSGRYDTGSSAKVGGGQMFSAITEAYPDLKDNTALYAKVLDAVSAGRGEFKNQQAKLVSMLADYNTFLHAGMPHKWFVSMVGAPTSNLTARLSDGTVLHGQAALDKISQIVITSSTAHEFDSGTDTPLDLGPSTAPSPAKK